MDIEFKIVKNIKGELEIELNNLTFVELLREYLNEDSSVTFAAWKRDHPTENPLLAIKTKGKSPKKAIEDAVNNILKDLDKLENNFKKLK